MNEELQSIDQMPVEELKLLARQLDIPGRSRMTRHELIAAIKEASRRRPDVPLIPHPPSSSAPYPGPFIPPSRVPYEPQEEELPRRYGEDFLVAMVRDPNWLFTYWELTPQRIEDIKKRFGHAVFEHSRWTLRLERIDTGEVQDIPILVDSGNWYLPVEEGKDYQVHMGVLTPAAKFILVLSSNVVSTPRRMPAASDASRWATSDEEFRKVLELSGGGAVPGSSSALSSTAPSSTTKARGTEKTERS